jgi:hypothetical protein
MGIKERVTEIPHTVWEGDFKLGHVVMRCFVLDNGERMIAMDSIEQLVGAMSLGTLEVEKGPAVDRMTKFITGEGIPDESELQ